MMITQKVIQKILLSVVSNFVVGLWDGLDEWVISRPEILSQSATVCVCVCVCVCVNILPTGWTGVMAAEISALPWQEYITM